MWGTLLEVARTATLVTVLAGTLAATSCSTICGDPSASCPSGSSRYTPDSCASQCASSAAYCTRDVGFSITVPDGCTMLSYNCVPEGSGGASCTTYFCCAPVVADASADVVAE